MGIYNRLNKGQTQTKTSLGSAFISPVKSLKNSSHIRIRYPRTGAAIFRIKGLGHDFVVSIFLWKTAEKVKSGMTLAKP